jgi:hypothetical protein
MKITTTCNAWVTYFKGDLPPPCPWFATKRLLAIVSWSSSYHPSIWSPPPLVAIIISARKGRFVEKHFKGHYKLLLNPHLVSNHNPKKIIANMKCLIL